MLMPPRQPGSSINGTCRNGSHIRYPACEGPTGVTHAFSNAARIVHCITLTTTKVVLLGSPTTSITIRYGACIFIDCMLIVQSRSPNR